MKYRLMGFVLGVITFSGAVEDDSVFDSIYLRPNAGPSDSQRVRNHTVQYFAYPDYKFDKLRETDPGLYETWADVGMDEWITLRVHVKGDTARAFINDARYPRSLSMTF